MTAAISLAASEPEDIGAGALAEECSAERLAQAKADMHEMKDKFPMQHGWVISELLSENRDH